LKRTPTGLCGFIAIKRGGALLTSLFRVFPIRNNCGFIADWQKERRWRLPSKHARINNYLERVPCPAHQGRERERFGDSSSRRRDPTIIRVLRKYLDTAGPPNRGVSVIAASKTDAKVPPTFEPKSEVGN
jgi:hypothetical protein